MNTLSNEFNNKVKTCSSVCQHANKQMWDIRDPNSAKKNIAAFGDFGR